MSDGRTWGTIIGGVVGYFTGGIGFAAGAAIGGAVGGLLEPKQRTETNRIDDIKVSISKYGDGIPETWGNNIPTATWIWSTYIIEIGEEQEAGKGGGAVNTNYRQFIHGLLCLGRTPPAGTTVAIRKLYINGKLNYDASVNLTAGQALATEENPWQSILLFPGTDDQLPIPIIEAWEGIGNVPAFRGRLTAFVFGLECPGGRVPQISAELVFNAGTVEESIVFAEPPIYGAGDDAWAVIRSTEAWHFTTTGADFSGDFGLRVSYLGAGSATLQRVIHDAGVHYGLDPCPVSGDGAPCALRMRRPAGGSPSSSHTIQIWNLEEGTITTLLEYVPDTSDNVLSPVSAGYDSSADLWAIRGDPSVSARGLTVTIIQGGVVTISVPIPGSGMGPVTPQDDTVYALSTNAGHLLITRFDLSGAIVDTSIGPTWADGGASNGWAALHPSDEGIYAWIRNTSLENLYLITFDTGTAVWTLVSSDFTPSGAEKLASYATTIFASPTYGVIGPSAKQSGIHRYNLIRFDVISPTEQTVAEFVENQNVRAGLTVDQIDVSAIDDSFWGLTLKGPASARSNIAPVMTYSAIGVVEEDGVLRYFHRATKTSVVTIPYEDLGFAEDGSEPGDPFPVVHMNAQELPRSITVSYNDYNFDYQVSAAKAMRYAVDSVLDESVTLDIATDGARAATIAYRLLFERWLAQNTRSLAVSRMYAYLSAGDVITVLSANGSYGDWMISKINDTGARIEIECFPADSDLLIQTVPGPSGYRGQTIDALPPSTRLQLLDMPILRDADDDAGIYAAMEGYGPGWGGAELFVGDDDLTLESRGTVSNAAVIGFVEGALGPFTMNIMDEVNSLIVSIGEGELNSTTRDILDTTAINAAAIGAQGRWEVIQFLRATSLGDGRYQLSGLVRGLRGTEHNRSNHQIADVFVLLGVAGTLRPIMEEASIGQDKLYEVVSKGRSSKTGLSQTYANTAEGLMPFSPWDLRKTKVVATNDQTLTVQRRSRLATNAFRATVPLGEASESWSWQLYTSNTFATLAGTFTSTTGTLALTSAQQTAIGLTPGAQLHVNVAMVSQSVGRGHALQESI